MSPERGQSPEQRKNIEVYASLRELLSQQLSILTPNTLRRVSSVNFAFFSEEAPVHSLEIRNPLQENTLDVAFSSIAPRRYAAYVLRSTGDMRLVTAFADGEAAQSAYSSPDSPLGGELGPHFIENFDYYHPLLEQSRVTALLELSHPREN